MDYYQAGGAAAVFQKKEFQLGDISKFSDGWDIPLLFFSVLVVDVVVLFLARYRNLGGKSLNEWYDKFGLSAVLADVLSIVLGFIIARYIYSTWLESRFGWNPIYFVLLLVAVQLVHDLLFYFLVIKKVPKGSNDMIDIFKSYAEENGGSILSADSIMMISSALIAMIMKHQSVGVSGGVFALFSYALPYILYTEPAKAKKLTPPPETKAVAKPDGFPNY